MANEIKLNYTAGLSGIYAVIRNASGQVYNRESNAFENWADANLSDYKIALSENGDGGGCYVGDFDPDGDGIVQVFDSSDVFVGSGEIYWSGVGEVTAEKMLANKAVQTKSTGKVDYYDDDGSTVLLSQTPADSDTEVTRTPS